MKLWLDCEFNGFGGALLSMALVAENGREWYEVLPCENPVEWVERNVIPVLGKEPVSYPLFQQGLVSFLKSFKSLEVVADWPEDFIHLNRALIAGHGRAWTVPNVTMMLKFDLPTEAKASKIPHNALEDARAMRAAEMRTRSMKRSKDQ